MVAPQGLRIAFFGTPDFAVPALDALLRSRHQVVAVVTQPDKPRGRGHKVSDAPVKAAASAAGIPILQPERLRRPDFTPQFAELGADLAVVAAYGKILPESLINTPRLGTINVHASLLPRYRGAAPVHRAVIAGERETGVTIMRVVKALDAGPMLAASRRAIDPDETSEQVEAALARDGATLLVEVVDRLSSGPVQEIAQDDAAATYAHRLTREDGVIDWTASATDVHNRIRGLHPWPHAFTTAGGRRFILHRSTVENTSGAAVPGAILEAEGDRLIVAAGAGTLRVLEIQPEGKRTLTAREFLAGHRFPPGVRFGS
jgi:methionyl-tRNA formyltransferase